MKISDEDFNALEAAINCCIANMDGKAVLLYMSQGHSEERMRWDFLHAVPGHWPIINRIYTYANDTHIDTALKRILGF